MMSHPPATGNSLTAGGREACVLPAASGTIAVPAVAPEPTMTPTPSPTPQQLLLSPDHAQFHRGVDLGVDVQAAGNRPLIQQALEGTPSFIVPDDGEQCRLRSQRSRITRNIGRTTQAFFRPLHLDHRHWGFR